MEVKQIITELEKEIARLREARALLAGGESTQERRRRGRPPANGAGRRSPSGRRGRLTPEGRKRISEALKKRWAARRKA